MPKNIKLNSYVGKDGMLHLDIPVDVRETELEVTVTLKPIGSKTEFLTEKEIKNLEWHDFIEMTYGCLADDPIIRYPQGEYDAREVVS